MQCTHYSCGKSITPTYFVEIEVPQYCGNCGAPYPWTEKAIAAEEEMKRLEKEEIAMAKTKVEIDMSDVDILTEKLSRLKILLIEVTELMNSLTHKENNCDDA